MVDLRRVRELRSGPFGNGPVVYVMSRDQRVGDNWALLFAQQQAIERRTPLVVACPVAADYPGAPPRQTNFIIDGLKEVQVKLASLHIPFFVSQRPIDEFLSTLTDYLDPGGIVSDFNPLKESRRWKSSLADRIEVPFYEVDAHNIIPCWELSDKQEYAAYTIRPKVTKKLNGYLTPIPHPVKHPFVFDQDSFHKAWPKPGDVERKNSSDRASELLKPGESFARKHLQRFLDNALSTYNDLRNNPVENGQSNLSPYLHFGQISTQRVALEAQAFDSDIASQEAFLEELIVRRELADNFCFYNDSYDSFDGFPAWAQRTLHEHRPDPRPYLYDRDTLEIGATHDELWNAAQIEMVVTGKMHGYMRMYWAKKILEWSPSPEEALEHAIYLNNKYELDGHDPNGYNGIAWSIGGVHDRAWSERDVFGKVRYMSYDGCRRKFRVADYINRCVGKDLGLRV